MTAIIEWQEGCVPLFLLNINTFQPSFVILNGTHCLNYLQTAHHKLFTVLDQYISNEDCYEGYLWVPFDTFLNVARLLQFNPDKIWYHSPFGTPVPNVALKDPKKHAPPAKISPDPYGNVTEIWSHWGTDWWHVLCRLSQVFLLVLITSLPTGGGKLNISIVLVTPGQIEVLVNRTSV